MRSLESVRKAVQLLGKKDRRKLALVVAIQAVLSFADLVAVVLIGVVALVATDPEASTLPEAVSRLITAAGLDGFSTLELALLLAVVAGLLLVLKSLLSFIATRRIFYFLARRQATLATKLTNEFLSQPLLAVTSRKSQDTAFALTVGTSALVLGVIGQGMMILSELALLLVLSVGLLIIDPFVTLFSLAYFAFVGVLLYRVTNIRATRLGRAASRTQIECMSSVQELLLTYRETVVGGRRSIFVNQSNDVRSEFASTQAKSVVLNQVPKYVFEVALVVGGSILAGIQFVTRDTTAAIGTVALFLAAASRVMPSLLRLQAALLSVRTATGVAAPTLALLDDLKSRGVGDEVTRRSVSEMEQRLVSGVAGGYPGFVGRVELRNVSLSYPGESLCAISEISMCINPGESIALVGTTGSGKTTLADTILGVLNPDRGDVALSGCGPGDAVLRWPGAVAYVAQNTALINGSIRSNVALGLPREIIDDQLVWEALERARLAQFLQSRTLSLDAVVGEHGMKLSGGQRQRLGIARALYTRPRLLVLDEATSALDAETESQVVAALEALKGSVTLVVIAHRLATVRGLDRIVLMQEGKISAEGSFEEVKRRAPEFARQAKLLGL